MTCTWHLYHKGHLITEGQSLSRCNVSIRLLALPSTPHCSHPSLSSDSTWALPTCQPWVNILTKSIVHAQFMFWFETSTTSALTPKATPKLNLESHKIENLRIIFAQLIISSSLSATLPNAMAIAGDVQTWPKSLIQTGCSFPGMSLWVGDPRILQLHLSLKIY